MHLIRIAFKRFNSLISYRYELKRNEAAIFTLDFYAKY